MEIDTHMHSLYSPDSRSKPEVMVQRAVAVGLRAIAVTDHNTLEGSMSARRCAEGRIIVIPGEELKTEKGDLIALFIEQEIQGGTFEEKIEAIRAQGGIAIVPHPGVSPRIERKHLQLADGYEAFNAILSPKANAMSVAKAAGLTKPALGASDAHLVREIGNGRTEVNDCETLAELRETILKSPRITRTSRSNPIVHRTNEAILFAVKGIWKR